MSDGGLRFASRSFPFLPPSIQSFWGAIILIQRHCLSYQAKPSQAERPPKGAQSTIDDFTTPIPEGNTIKKAYICNAKTRQIKKGDIILFYRSTDRKELTSIGVVESTMATKDPAAITARVGNRTVYSLEEIDGLAESEALAIIFRHMGNFNKPIEWATLQQNMKIAGQLQSIRRISHRTYEKIIQEGQGCS